MDLKYFKCQIEDELQGAKDYIKRAIEIKPMSPKWGKMFYDMSTQELNHAENLYSMFNEYCSKITGSFEEVPKYISETREKVVDMYTEEVACIKAMQSIFKD